MEHVYTCSEEISENYCTCLQCSYSYKWPRRPSKGGGADDVQCTGPIRAKLPLSKYELAVSGYQSTTGEQLGTWYPWGYQITIAYLKLRCQRGDITLIYYPWGYHITDPIHHSDSVVIWYPWGIKSPVYHITGGTIFP